MLGSVLKTPAYSEIYRADVLQQTCEPTPKRFLKISRLISSSESMFTECADGFRGFTLFKMNFPTKYFVQPFDIL